jgi:peptidoglycan/LPS O-acetylase OafA/YrhL
MRQIPNEGFNPNIHGARGFLCLMIYFFHVSFSGLATFPIISQTFVQEYILTSMKFSVELFFGISGIVIVGALLRTPSVRYFMWERATRIFPVLWVTIIAISALGALSNRRLPGWESWLANFLAPPPFFNVPLVHPAAWSLGYEWTFYALCGCAWFLRGRNIPFWQWIAGSVGILLICLYPRSILMGPGVLIALGYGRSSLIALWARFPFINLVIFMLGWRLIDLTVDSRLTHVSPLFMPLSEWVWYIPALCVAGAFGGITLLGIYRGHGVLSQVLRSKLMFWLGTISYSFYLWHPIMLSITKRAFLKTGVTEMVGNNAQLAFFIIALPPSLIVAHFSQVVLEKQFTRWLRRLGPEKAHARKPATAMISRDEAVSSVQ